MKEIFLNPLLDYLYRVMKVSPQKINKIIFELDSEARQPLGTTQIKRRLKTFDKIVDSSPWIFFS